MSNDPEPRIVAVDQIDNGVLVSFEDGKQAIYPAFLLHSAIELCEIIQEATLERRQG